MNILLVDDHPIIIEFYTSFVLEYFSGNKKLTISKASNCEQAYNLIELNAESPGFDIAYIDYRLPEFKSKNMLSGGDIITLLRKHCPHCKIILITGHTEVLYLYDMIWNFHPEGFAVKCDINYDTLLNLTKSVEAGAYYKSETIVNATKKVLAENILVDSTNRRIVALLLQGHKVKDLYRLVDLKPSTIHRRILNIKTSLKIEDDTSIIRQLIACGYMGQNT